MEVVVIVELVMLNLFLKKIFLFKEELLVIGNKKLFLILLFSIVVLCLFVIGIFSGSMKEILLVVVFVLIIV